MWIPSRYDYGWPYAGQPLRGSLGGYSEDITNAILAYKMDEGSGNIVDEVSSLACPVVNTPTYNVAAPAGYTAYTPGITCDRVSASAFGISASAIPTAIGTSDFTIEVWFTTTESGFDSIWYNMDNGSGTAGMYFPYIRPASNLIQFFTYGATFGGNLSIAWSVTGSSWTDGVFHKLRLWVDRSANADLYLDGALQTPSGSNDYSSKSATSFPSHGVYIGRYYGGATGTVTIYFLKVSLGLINSGGPGGG